MTDTTRGTPKMTPKELRHLIVVAARAGARYLKVGEHLEVAFGPADKPLPPPPAPPQPRLPPEPSPRTFEPDEQPFGVQANATAHAELARIAQEYDQWGAQDAGPENPFVDTKP